VNTILASSVIFALSFAAVAAEKTSTEKNCYWKEPEQQQGSFYERKAEGYFFYNDPVWTCDEVPKIEPPKPQPKQAEKPKETKKEAEGPKVGSTTWIRETCPSILIWRLIILHLKTLKPIFYCNA
jgi:hypothetical protein